jgi:hypothetical protein
MNVSQLRKVLEVAEQIYRDSGKGSTADSLGQFLSLCEGYETMTVSSFVAAISKATAKHTRGQL